jgi:phenylpropionate dioxygenase-like ring-hydroxylating dioxygenase large terminal subunit
MQRQFPFPLPNGWFMVAWADEIAPGEVRSLRYFGEDLVLFRTAAGEPRVLDAFCPHLGAHLGHGGRVEGDTIRCPFHGWRFDGSGRCTEVPYATRIPAAARLGSWPAVERNRCIWVWRHAEKKPPAWDVPLIPEAESDAWSSFDRYRWKIRSRSQEMGENAVDRAHFRYVHGTMTVPESEVTVEGTFRRSLQRAQMQTPRGPVDGSIDAQNFGPGCGFTRFSGICETVLIGATTPIDEEFCDVRFSFTQQKVNGEEPRGGVAAAIIRDIVKQMNEDIPIWENKQYLDRPALCDGDGPIAEFRRWMKQFYSESASA